MATAVANATALRPTAAPAPRAPLSAPATQAPTMAGDRLQTSAKPLLPGSAAGKAVLGLGSLGLGFSALRMFGADRSPAMAAVVLVGLGAPLLLLEGVRALTDWSWVKQASLPKLALGVGAGAFAGGASMYLTMMVGGQLFPSLVHPLIGTLGSMAIPALAVGGLAWLGTVHLANRLGK